MAQTEHGALIVAANRAGLSVSDFTKLLAEGLKKCTICKEWKNKTCFVKDKARKDGLSTRCSDCNRALWILRDITRGPQSKIDLRDGDKVQARARINIDIKLKLRPNPNDLHCSICGHKGADARHEYHHIMGYSPENHCNVLPLCSKCHHEEDKNNVEN